MPTVPVFYGIWIGKPTERLIQLFRFHAASMINLGFRCRLARGDDHDRRRSQSEGKKSANRKFRTRMWNRFQGSEVQTETVGNALEAKNNHQHNPRFYCN